MEAMGIERFVHQQNLARYRKMLSEKMHEHHRRQILTMLAEEVAQDWLLTDTPIQSL